MLLGENAEESEVESDQPVKFQSPSERFQRYFNSELCEVPDPEEWAVPQAPVQRKPRNSLGRGKETAESFKEASASSGTTKRLPGAPTIGCHVQAFACDVSM